MPNFKTTAIYCGGLDVLSGIFEGLSDSFAFEEEWSKKNEEVRIRIINALNQHAEVKNLKNLFKEVSALLVFGKFSPIIFNFRLPLSLQSSRRIRLIAEESSYEVEEFKIVYDGQLLMIVAPCSLQERPSGVIDIRDRFVDILKNITSPRMIPPCLTHHAFVLTTSKGKKPETGDVYLQVKEGTSLINMLRALYLTISYPMSAFYDTCETSDKIEEIKNALAETQQNLFRGLRDLETCRWNDFLKRRQVMGRIKTCMLQILEKMSEYPSLMRELQKMIAHVRNLMQEKRIFREFMEKNNWLEYADTDPLDTETLTRTVEYAHIEMETHKITTSETKAALIGGIVGTGLTLLLSYLLGLFSPQLNTSPTNSTIPQVIYGIAESMSIFL